MVSSEYNTLRVYGCTGISKYRFKFGNKMFYSYIRVVIPSLNSNQHTVSLRKRYMRIMLTCPCNVDPLTFHFYIVKFGFTEVYTIFLLFL